MSERPQVFADARSDLAHAEELSGGAARVLERLAQPGVEESQEVLVTHRLDEVMTVADVDRLRKAAKIMRAEADALRDPETNSERYAKLEEAQKHERKRVRKILDKIHAALDDAGAPRGDDLSYSERIRRLKRELG